MGEGTAMEIIFGALAAWGLIMLLWTLFGVLLLPLQKREKLRLSVVIRSEEDAPALERYVRGLEWLRDLGLVWWDILILEDALSPEAQDTARRLSEKAQSVDLVTGSELKDWLD
jgi:hypothetical protein